MTLVNDEGAIAKVSIGINKTSRMVNSVCAIELSINFSSSFWEACKQQSQKQLSTLPSALALHPSGLNTELTVPSSFLQLHYKSVILNIG